MHRLALALAAIGLLAGCARDYVKVDDAALGRVVVYRNGVAYFERRAHLTGDELELSVPTHMVNDFLKSLTVKDAATGRSLPVSFPSPGMTSGNLVQMKIRLPDRDSTEVLLSYITEAPAWKPSYRVVVKDDGQVRLEGWAIVDNTSGETWEDVVVGVGSSSALSFRYDLWSIRSVERETLASEDRFALAPPSSVSPYGGTGVNLLAELADDDINRPASHPERPVDAEQVARSGAGSSTRGAARAPAPEPDPRRRAERDKREQNTQRIRQIADSLKAGRHTVVIEGWSAPGESAPEEKALDRANLLRNQLIEEGVPPAQLEVRALGTREDAPAGVRLVARTDDEAPARSTSDQPVGESHFESATPITVARGTSVMVSIVDDEAQGELVYYFDPESARGDRRFAFKAVRLINPSDNTLESGPVTVYDQQGFVGEGLADPIPPRSLALVPFALDRQVVVDDEVSTRDRIARLVRLSRGVLTTEVQHLRRVEYQVHNRLAQPAQVYVRHTVERGWELTDAPKERQRIGRVHLFPVIVEPGQSRRVVIEQATPLVRTVDLRAPDSLEMIRVYLSDSTSHPGLAEPMKELLALYTEMQNREESIENLRERLQDYRERMDELHVQVVSLEAVRSGGTLLRHLKTKMREISELVQRTTLSLVENQEGLMMARIRFQDAVAELTLESAPESRVTATGGR
jgi:hypothetical protein